MHALASKEDSLPLLPALPEATLQRSRTHEATGAARRIFALWLARQLDGPIFWITPAWAKDRLNPHGVSPWINPSRLTLLCAPKPEDILWSMEEALRSGTVPLVVAEALEPPALTPVRRLHLAAEQSKAHPLGLLLSAGAGGAQGVESRWQLEPLAAPLDCPAWALTRSRARRAPVATWHISRQGTDLSAMPVSSHETAANSAPEFAR